MNANGKAASKIAMPAAHAVSLARGVGDAVGSGIKPVSSIHNPAPDKPNHLASIYKLVCSIAIRFIKLTPDEIDEEIERSLAEIGEYGGYDRCYLSVLSRTAPGQGKTIQWCADGARPLIGGVEGLLKRRFSGLTPQNGAREHTGVGSLAELCEFVRREGIAWTPDGTDSDVLIPLSCEGRLIGFIGAHPAGKVGGWREDDVTLLNAAAEVFAHVVEHERVEAESKALQKLEVVGQVASSVAHDVNGPLAVILGFAQLLMAEDLSDSVGSDVQTIYEEAQKATNIFHNFLSCVSRSEKRVDEMDVTILIHRTIEAKYHDFQASNISIETELPSEKLTVTADELQMEKVLFNILTNAQQAMFEANGKGTIQVQAQKVDDKIRISLKDDGLGIPAEIMGRILDPFFTSKTSGHGTGLGLSVAHGIVLDHGGCLWFESDPGNGAAFHIDLPSTRTHLAGLTSEGP